MRHIIFETPGLIDLRAITTFGINSKPNSENPIGYFGTGLKYAIAVCLRNKQDITVYRGSKRITFNVSEQDFREKKFSFIKMMGHRGKLLPPEQLPFTTELGKNWQLWQAMRELYTNTLDESGRCYEPENDRVVEFRKDKTYIIVDGDDFAAEFDALNKNFLKDGLRKQGDAVLQVLPGPSEHIYYRSMRVYDLPKPSIHTYNILTQLDLTEDRTAKNTYTLPIHVAAHVAMSTDEQFIMSILQAKETDWEHRLDFSNLWFVPSEQFQLAVASLRMGYTGFNSSAYSYAREQSQQGETI